MCAILGKCPLLPTLLGILEPLLGDFRSDNPPNRVAYPSPADIGEYPGRGARGLTVLRFELISFFFNKQPGLKFLENNNRIPRLLLSLTMETKLFGMNIIIILDIYSSRRLKIDYVMLRYPTIMTAAIPFTIQR